MKKEIHLRFIKRIVFVCLLVAVGAVAGTGYLEYQRLDETLLDNARRESLLFSAYCASYADNPGPEALTALKKSVGTNLDRSSFILIELLPANTEPLLIAATADGSRILETFREQGIILPPTGRADMVRMIMDKRIYLQTMLPLPDSAGGSAGHLRGVYRVSLDTMQALLARFALTAAVVAATAFSCGAAVYFGIVLLNRHLIRSASDLSRANTFLLRTVGAALAKSDTGAPGHGQRVVIYAARLAEAAGLKRAAIRALLVGGFLHDIDMLPISPAILGKTAPLDSGERSLVTKHPGAGAARIKRYRWLREAVPVVRAHHEKYDGNGYPAGLMHAKIPLAARVFALADAFDALSSARPYREALPVEEALRTIEQESGTHFDPVLVATFIEMAPGLHRRLSSLDDTQLDRELDTVLKKYMTV